MRKIVLGLGVNDPSGAGRRGGEIMPYVNPVSTAFSLQALALWEQHRAGNWRFEVGQLI